MPTNATVWFEKAKRNLKTAHLNYDNHGFGDVTCYFAHQTTEVALKAYLVVKNQDFPKVHALPKLISLCISLDSDFSKFADDVAFLNGFYIETKYPLDMIFEPTEADIQRALISAQNILELVKDKLQ